MGAVVPSVPFGVIGGRAAGNPASVISPESPRTTAWPVPWPSGSLGERFVMEWFFQDQPWPSEHSHAAARDPPKPPLLVRAL